MAQTGNLRTHKDALDAAILLHIRSLQLIKVTYVGILQIRWIDVAMRRNGGSATLCFPSEWLKKATYDRINNM